ncbi:hypothetical protein SAMN05892877_12366 [Rhizobium subbaraonis]|uniref:Holin (3TMs family) n=1 Tax=Rhizobium subbaraonis TaxID=908946 RepID=A0A285UXS1_9HYPH|nr:hypothetical protein [Rhizobium subbaraonis]SOC46632.1 hypothetical protein SAMN05892877_12366 [Rhizobium subbaraonis]
MSLLIGTLTGIAAKVGAPVVKSILGKHVGGLPGTLAGTVIDHIAERVGVDPEKLPEVDPQELDNAVRDVEAATPDLIQLYQRGVVGQFALLQAETAEGFWASAWRWGWMYLLAFLWLYAFLLGPLVRAFGIALEPIDAPTLMTLTGWFISLYMGGHTVKEIGRQTVEAVKTWKKSP